MALATPLPRPTAMLVIAALACSFAGNHVAARLAFDHGTGLVTAILCRAGLTLAVLGLLVLWQRASLRLPPGTGRWQWLLGVLLAAQSILLYSAVARIPVALALLVANSFPILLALITWAAGGKRPTRQAWTVMGVIFLGLLMALDLPARLAEARGATGDGTAWGLGIGLALGGALCFATGLWVTDHRLRALAGPVRSFYTIAGIFTVAGLAGLSGALPHGLAWPHDAAGWGGLSALMLLYCIGFVGLFLLLPRLDMARNAPVMNMEPIATLLIGWVVLGQWISPLQMAGGLVVLGGIVMLSRTR